jgi:hypothetical protein
LIDDFINKVNINQLITDPAMATMATLRCVFAAFVLAMEHYHLGHKNPIGIILHITIGVIILWIQFAHRFWQLYQDNLGHHMMLLLSKGQTWLMRQTRCSVAFQRNLAVSDDFQKTSDKKY